MGVAMWVETRNSKTEVELAWFAIEPRVREVYQDLRSGKVKREQDDVEYALGRSVGLMRFFDDYDQVAKDVPSGLDPIGWMPGAMSRWAEANPEKVKLHYSREVIALALLAALKADEGLPAAPGDPTPVPSPKKGSGGKRGKGR